MSLRIIPFKPELSIYFRDLNLSWLEKYFYVEPKDAELLENCQSSIIDKGGYIFFAEMDMEIVGCYSMIRLQDSVYELGKMAVAERCQGKKIGQKLLSHGITFAKSQNWQHLLLYSNTILGPAIYIYKKFGFKEVVMEKDSPYARSNIKMQLDLF